MIHRVSDASQISYRCEQLGKEFVYSIRIVAGTKTFSTKQKPLPLDVEGIRDLVQGYWAVVEGHRAEEFAPTNRESRRLRWLYGHPEACADRQATVERYIRYQNELDGKTSPLSKLPPKR